MKPQILKGGPFHMPFCCLRCGKPLTVMGAVTLELDQRTGEYHDFGNVPVVFSQGCFDFGPDCAAILRERARRAATPPPFPYDEMGEAAP